MASEASPAAAAPHRDVIACIDGGARGNPGPAAAGVVIKDAKTGKAIYKAGIFIGHATNNIAEYQGLLNAFKAAAKLGAGDRVITSSGIVGVVVTVKEKSATIRSADAKLEITKSAIAEITERSGEPSES